jgi:hypothetical protein
MKNSNKFKKKIRSNNDEWNVPRDYYFEVEGRDEIDNLRRYSALPLNTAAEYFEWDRIFGGLSSLSPEEQLEALQGEIKTRIKITKNEIFKIGELLIYAKKLCQQEGKKFQEWIRDNFEFSYETANNFMNVYKHCLGVRSIAMNLSPSILYQISAPSFPDELRKYLFDTEQLDEFTNGSLREITRRYKEGGFEAIKDDIEELNRGHIIYRQSHYTLDMVENALRTLEDLKEKIEKRGRLRFTFMPFEDLSKKNDEPEAFEVNSKLFSSLQSAIALLDKARHESKEVLSNMLHRSHKKGGMVISDGRTDRRKEAEFNAEYEKLKKESENV